MLFQLLFDCLTVMILKNFELLDFIENQIISTERWVYNIDSMNDSFGSNNNAIMYLNIRSLNANFPEIELLIDNLKFKPFLIICTETWQITHEKFYALTGYDMFYNKSYINRADGVVVYIRDDIVTDSDAVIHVIDDLKIITISIVMLNGSKLEISALYRSHDLEKLDFIHNLNTFLNEKKIVKIILL